MNAWKSISKEDTKGLVILMGFRLDAAIAFQGYATKYILDSIDLIYF